MLDAKVQRNDSLYLQTFPAPFLQKMRSVPAWNDLSYKWQIDDKISAVELIYYHKAYM